MEARHGWRKQKSEISSKDQRAQRLIDRLGLYIKIACSSDG